MEATPSFAQYCPFFVSQSLTWLEQTEVSQGLLLMKYWSTDNPCPSVLQRSRHFEHSPLCPLLWSMHILIFSGERRCWRNSDIRCRKDSHSFEDARRNMGVPETTQALFSQTLALSQGLPARPPQLSGDTLYFLLVETPTPNCKVTFWSWVPSLLWWMDISEWTEHHVPHWR